MIGVLSAAEETDPGARRAVTVVRTTRPARRLGRGTLRKDIEPP
jgi:hypothetical protein